jgi:response regulator RpfG family c-di-GMP phosphodiesterase
VSLPTSVVSSAPVTKRRPRILCVDDEPRIFEGLRRQLAREYEVVGTDSGLEALALLADGSFQVIISDMRMPGMDGVELLSEARACQSDTVRVLLTGQADIADAINAVNRGNIFRFLVKPCPPDLLSDVLRDAVEQYRVVTAERELLESTLRGAVEALLEVLSLAHPAAFARAQRIERIVKELVVATKPEQAWSIEVGAMLSQIGTVILAPETIQKLNAGSTLTAEEQLQVRVLPWHSERLLGHIPRLDVVREILRDQTVPYDKVKPGAPGEASATRGAQMLRLAVDLERLEAAGVHRKDALRTLASRDGSYDPSLIRCLAAQAESDGEEPGVCAISADQLRPGMKIAGDVSDDAGRLLVGRGYEVTDNLIQRIRNWKASTVVSEPIFVFGD